MKKYIAEFIGTLFLVTTIGCTVLAPTGTGVIPPLAIGAILMVMVFAGGHISGAHYNPAVTLAVTLRGKSTWSEAGKYVLAQVLAALAATALVCALGFRVMPEMPTPEPHAFFPAVLAEFLFTFALAWVVLNVATAKGTAGNSFYGIAIGFTVLAGAFAVGGVSGGAFNPAVAIALCTMKLVACSDLAMYFVGQFAGAALAAFAFKFCNKD
jgi:aquaporin Z